MPNTEILHIGIVHRHRAVALVRAKGNRLANITFGKSADVMTSDIDGNLFAYMDVGSSGKAVKVSVMSGSSDITSTILDEHFTFSLSKIKAASNVKIVVTSGNQTATFNIK